MSEGEWDFETFCRDVQYGCAVVKLGSGLLVLAALALACLDSLPGADALAQPGGTVIVHALGLIDRSLSLVL